MFSRLSISFFFFLVLCLPHARAGEGTYDVAAFVWPAYQPEKRFQDIGVFKDGKGEWEAIYKAQSKFPDDHQPRVPLWGYTDESDPKAVAQKIAAAASHGVNVFIYDWYWYDGKPFLENALNDGFLKAPNRDRMSFYLMWANHDHTSYLDPTAADKSHVYWRGGVDRSTFDTMVDHIIRDYFSQPNYYKIDGEPVFAIYELSTLIDGLGGIEKTKAALDDFARKTRAAGHPGLHLQGILWGAIPANLSGVPGDTSSTQNNTITDLGIQSLTNYQWVHYVPVQDYKKWGDIAVQSWEKWSREFTVPYFPHVSISWDNNPRFPKAQLQSRVTNANPTDFKAFLEKAKQYLDQHPNQPKLITINAWNEWAEGSYLEPDKLNGYKYLEAVKSVFPPKK
jgi:hypothetical protein